MRVELEGSGELVNCHGEDICAGHVCPIHNRTNHHMRGWPQHWRDDRGLMERICPHGVGHPDPDHMLSVMRRHGPIACFNEGVHGCDGCCVSKTEESK